MQVGRNERRIERKIDLPILLDLVQKRRQPAIGHFYMGVQEGHSVALGNSSAAKTRPHETTALGVSHDDYLNRQRLDEIVERFAQIGPILAQIVD